MSFTPNKNIETPAHGADVNTWDVNANSNFTIIDTCFSGTLLLNATGLSGAQALTQANVQPPTIQISGAPTAAITYTVPASIGGVWTVRNTTTGGFAVGIVSLAGGGTIIIPANQELMVWCDGSITGMLLVNSVYDNSGVHFPDGTVQASAVNSQTKTVAGALFVEYTGIPSTVNNLEFSFDLTLAAPANILFVQFYISGVLDTSANYFNLTMANLNGTISGGSTSSTGGMGIGSFGSVAPINGKFWLNNIQSTGRTEGNFVASGADGTNSVGVNTYGSGGHISIGGPITGVRFVSTVNLNGRLSMMSTL